ncbi:MAG: 4-oxalocrotonate tautomerase [Candidatus Bathyarchaeia archaeon]
MTAESKRKIAKGITKVFDEIGIQKERVEIIIYEAPKTDSAKGGELHSELETLKNKSAIAIFSKVKV